MKKDSPTHSGRKKRTLAHRKVEAVINFAVSHPLETNTINPVLENFPFEHQFIAFTKAINKLKADKDKVNKKQREYVNTAVVLPVYQKCFGEHALGETTIRYRIRQIKSTEFIDDFIKLEDTIRGLWEPKYYMNRLNIKLLKRIYLPNPGFDIIQMVETTALFEQGLDELDAFDVEDDDDIFNV